MLLYLVTKNHSFSDGNKRIAATLFLWFMAGNGILYNTDGTKRIADNTLVALTLMIAESRTEEKDVMVKVVVNLINKNNYEQVDKGCWSAQYATTPKFLAHSEALKLWRMYAFDLSKSHGERECCLFLSLGNGLLLGDTSLLASELAQVVQLGTTHFTDLVYLDRIDVRGLKGENTLYAHGARHLAHGETLLLTLAVDLDDHAAIELDTLL